MRSPVGTPAPASRPVGPSVLLALFEGRREAAVLGTRAFVGVAVSGFNDRQRLLSHAAERRPTVLILPPYDKHGAPTSPLVLRCRRELPDVVVVVLVTDASAIGNQLLSAVRAGAVVARVSSAEELRATLAPVLASQALTMADLQRIDAAIAASLADVPPLVGDAMRAAVRVAGNRDAITMMARSCGLSRRTLSRRMHAAGVPSLAELVLYAKLLLARAIAERDVTSVLVVAQSSGFASVRAFRQALETYVPDFESAEPIARRETASFETVLHALRKRGRSSIRP